MKTQTDLLGGCEAGGARLYSKRFRPDDECPQHTWVEEAHVVPCWKCRYYSLTQWTNKYSLGCLTLRQQGYWLFTDIAVQEKLKRHDWECNRHEKKRRSQICKHTEGWISIHFTWMLRHACSRAWRQVLRVEYLRIFATARPFCWSWCVWEHMYVYLESNQRQMWAHVWRFNMV